MRKQQIMQATADRIRHLRKQKEIFDGFCSAVDLMVDYLEHKAPGRSKTNQEQPPKA